MAVEFRFTLIADAYKYYMLQLEQRNVLYITTRTTQCFRLKTFYKCTNTTYNL